MEACDGCMFDDLLTTLSVCFPFELKKSKDLEQYYIKQNQSYLYSTNNPARGLKRVQMRSTGHALPPR